MSLPPISMNLAPQSHRAQLPEIKLSSLQGVPDVAKPAAGESEACRTAATPLIGQIDELSNVLAHLSAGLVEQRPINPALIEKANTLTETIRPQLRDLRELCHTPAVKKSIETLDKLVAP